MTIVNEWIRSLMVYEPGKPIEEVAREMGFDSVDDICKLASNENSLGPSPLAIQRMREVAGKMHLYPDGGAFYLRRELAKRLNVEMEQLVVGNGSNELLELLARVYLNERSNVVFADRAFIVYRLIAAAYRAEARAVPMQDYKHDLPAILAAIDENTRIVFISNPNNPTGTYVTQEEVDAFMAAVPDHVAVVFDEAYIELMPDDLKIDVVKYISEREHVYVLRTFSKAYGLAGLRVGYGISSVEGTALIHRVRQPFNVNAMGQAAAIAALNDEEHVLRTQKMVSDGIELLQNGFTELGLETVPTVINFMLVKVGQGREVFKELQKLKVIVRPMDGYKLPDWVRVTIGTELENRMLLNAVRDLKKEGKITA